MVYTSLFEPLQKDTAELEKKKCLILLVVYPFVG